MTKNKLFIQKSDGELFPVSDMFLKIVYDNLPTETGEEIAAKTLISMCLFGIEDDRTQDLVREAVTVLNKREKQ
jgi:hypothetical protein